MRREHVDWYHQNLSSQRYYHHNSSTNFLDLYVNNCSNTVMECIHFITILVVFAFEISMGCEILKSILRGGRLDLCIQASFKSDLANES